MSEGHLFLNVYHSVFSINIFSTYRKSTTDPRSKDIIMKPFQSYMNDRNDNTGTHNMTVVTTTAPITSNIAFILFLQRSHNDKHSNRNLLLLSH